MKHLIVLAVLLTGCQLTQQDVKPVPEPEDTDLCDAAGENIERMECMDRRGHPMWVNKSGEPYGDMCRKAQKEGGIFLNPKCVTNATSCEEAKKCPTQS